MNNVNYIFDVVGKKGQAMRGFLDMETQEIVVYDDKKGKELFRMGGKGQSNQLPSKPATKKRKTTLTFEICNGSDEKKTATLFGSNLEPLIQPLGVSVIIKEIEKNVFNSHNYLRRDILSNNLKVLGFSLFVDNPQQFNNNLTFGTIKPYGVIEKQPFSPLNFLGKNQVDSNMMDMSKKINWNVDGRSVLYVPIEPKSKVTLLFNVIEDVADPLMDDYKSGGVNDGGIQARAIKKRQMSYDGDESNTIFNNVNSGGLGAVNFDGDRDLGVEERRDSFIDMNNYQKDGEAVRLMKMGILVLGIGVVFNAISKMK